MIMRDTIRDKRKLKSSLGLVPDNRGISFTVHVKFSFDSA